MDHTTSEEQLLVLNLPDEVLVLILGHLPLLDLAKARLVSQLLRRDLCVIHVGTDAYVL